MISYREHFTHGSVQIRRVSGSTKWCVLSPGLGSTVSDSHMIRTIYQRITGRCNVILLEHPYHGINFDTPHPEKLTPELCRNHAREVFRWLLETKQNVSDVVSVGTSLGFWSMNQALQEFNDSRVRLIISKSGIVSYLQILIQLGGIEGAKKFLKIGGDGWGQLVVNPGDKPLRVHINFLQSIIGMSEITKNQQHKIHAIHGEDDQWTKHGDMGIFIRDECPKGSALFTHKTGHGFHNVPDIDGKIALKTVVELKLTPIQKNPEKWWIQS